MGREVALHDHGQALGRNNRCTERRIVINEGAKGKGGSTVTLHYWRSGWCDWRHPERASVRRQANRALPPGSERQVSAAFISSHYKGYKGRCTCLCSSCGKHGQGQQLVG